MALVPAYANKSSNKISPRNREKNPRPLLDMQVGCGTDEKKKKKTFGIILVKKPYSLCPNCVVNIRSILEATSQVQMLL